MFFTQTLIRGQAVKKIFWSDAYSFYILVKDRSIDVYSVKCELLSEQYVFGTIFDATFYHECLFVVSDSGHVSKLSYCKESRRWKNEFNESVAKPGFHAESPVSVVSNARDGSFMVLFLEQVIQYWLYDSLANNTKKSGFISDLGLIYCAAFVPYKGTGAVGNSASIGTGTGTGASGPYILVMSERAGLVNGYQVTLFNCANQTRSKFVMPSEFGAPLFVLSTSDGLVHCLTVSQSFL